VGTDRKMASTPIKNAGHKIFSLTPNFIFDTLESVSCRQTAGLHVYLSYRFPDGMIHDSLVPRSVRGVAHLMQLRAAQLITRTGSARIHRRRWRSESLVYKQLDLNATILCTSFPRIVLRHWVQFTVAVRGHNPAQRNVVVFNQVANDRISTTLAQRAIESNAAS